MVKKGYKETEIGVIPEDWEINTLEPTIGKVKSGKRLPKGYLVTQNITPHPYIRVIDMKMGMLDTANIMYVPDEAFPPISQYRIYKDDLYISVAGTLGLVGRIPEFLDGANLTENANRITDISCDVNYLLYWLMGSEIQKRISDSQTLGAQPKLALYQIRNFPIPTPRLEEQQKIAEALSDMDNLISSLEKLIEKKKSIKQGVMQELLTGKKRLSGFSGAWKEFCIGKIGEFYGGLSGKTKNDFNCGNAHYITFLNVLSNVKIDTSILASVNVKETENQNAVKKGDLFFNTSSETPEEVGMCAVLDEEIENTYLNSFCFGFRMKNNEHNPIFLTYYLNSSVGRKIMSTLAQGATRYNLSKNNFAETIIELPIKEEQTAIASILSDMDAEITALEQKLEKCQKLKQGMMQQLLTGKIRLI